MPKQSTMIKSSSTSFSKVQPVKKRRRGTRAKIGKRRKILFDDVDLSPTSPSATSLIADVSKESIPEHPNSLISEIRQSQLQTHQLNQTRDVSYSIDNLQGDSHQHPPTVNTKDMSPTVKTYSTGIISPGGGMPLLPLLNSKSIDADDASHGAVLDTELTNSSSNDS